MSDEQYKSSILELISEHDGEWGWYQIDRALTTRGLPTAGMMAALKALEHDGFIEMRRMPEWKQPHYFLTEKGTFTLKT